MSFIKVKDCFGDIYLNKDKITHIEQPKGKKVIYVYIGTERITMPMSQLDKIIDKGGQE